LQDHEHQPFLAGGQGRCRDDQLERLGLGAQAPFHLREAARHALPPGYALNGGADFAPAARLRPAAAGRHVMRVEAVEHLAAPAFINTGGRCAEHGIGGGIALAHVQIAIDQKHHERQGVQHARRPGGVPA
jgi:hypothetical protein